MINFLGFLGNSRALSTFWCSSTFKLAVGGMVWALWWRVLITAALWAEGWWEEYSLGTCLCGWVSYIPCTVVLSGFRRISTSRNASWAWAYLSNVNWMVSSMVFEWQWKSCTISDSRAQHVSSTYLFHSFGGLG